MLSALGVKLGLDPEGLQRCLSETKLCFMFAQTHHAAMRHVAPVRVELGTRTIFNLLGPLSNPAGVKRQLLGVFSEVWLEPLTQVLKELGSERVWTVHGSDGLDEMTTTGPTHVAALENGAIRRFTVTPEEVGLPTGKAGRSAGRRSGAQRGAAARGARRRAHPLSRRRPAQRRRLPCGRGRGGRPARRPRPRLPRPRQRRREGDPRSPRQVSNALSGQAMSDVLARIEAYKRQEIAAAKAAVPQAEIERRAREAPPPARLCRAPSSGISPKGRPALIAEVKKASPSKGLIRADFDPPSLARRPMPRAAPPACPFSPTSRRSRAGPNTLPQAREASGLPALRKDFLFEPYQVYEARAWGADCILVIMASVTDDEARGADRHRARARHGCAGRGA